MTSKIINMADQQQDAADRMLETLFQVEDIPDAGFSDQVLRRLRRQVWVRRLALPIAMLVGAACAARPALELLHIGSDVVDQLAGRSLFESVAAATQWPVVLAAALVVAIAMVTFRLSEE